MLPGERDDLLDVGVWELDPVTVDLLTAKRFLNRTHIAITEDLSDGIYFFAGAPIEWATINTAARSARWKWLKFATFPHPNPASIPRFDDRFHVALGMDKNPDLPRSLVGISGCPIWKLSDLPVSDDWTPDDARIVAIETCVYAPPTSAVRGTTWKHILPVLAGLCPDVREGFKLKLRGIE